MGDTARERYAVVSCHVERPLDDGVWARYRQFVESRPGGFVIASLVRPPDLSESEDPHVWLERARILARLGPFGQHTHWTSPSHARPLQPDRTADRVHRDATWLQAAGLRPTLFCGGGWYTDARVAETCAALGYVDCTPTPHAPPYLDGAAPRAELAAPASLVLASGKRLSAVPTTHSPGSLARAVLRPRRLREPVVHVAFHDTDLADSRRRLALRWALAVLGKRRRALDLDELVRRIVPCLTDVPWAEVARGESASGDRGKGDRRLGRSP